MYSKYLELKKNKKEISANHNNIFSKKEDNDDLYVIDRLISSCNMDDSCNLNQWIFFDFPESEYIFLLEKFIDSGESLHHVYPEYCKLIYHLWPKYMDLPHKDKPKTYPKNQIYELLYTIKTQLKIIHEQIPNMPFRNSRGTRYAFWHYFALYPLLEDEGFEMLKIVSTFRYDDAQDGIMFALYQIDPFTNFDVVGDILKYWDEHENIRFCFGTGMIPQLESILEKYDKIKFDYRSNKKFTQLLTKHNIKF